MTITIPTGVALSDQELLVEVKRLSCLEQEATARLIGALAELDARRLYLAEGCSSLFTYCTEVLHLSEHAAYLRIEAARAARKWPVIIGLIADSSLHRARRVETGAGRSARRGASCKPVHRPSGAQSE